MKNSHSESYAAAGVDVTAGYEAVERIKPMVESTYIPGVHGHSGRLWRHVCPRLGRDEKAGAGLRHRRRGHQAEAGHAAGQA